MKIRNGMATVLLVFVLTACATYSKVDTGQRVPVGEGITVTAVGSWASISHQLIAQTGADAIWTVDGPNINQLRFFSAIRNGEAMQDAPNDDVVLPVWRVGMTEPDVMEFVEGTYSKVTKAPLIETENLRPHTFLGQPGFAFEYNLVNQKQLEVRGLVIGTQAGGVLRLMIFEAPKLHFFDKDAVSVRTIAASAQLTGS